MENTINNQAENDSNLLNFFTGSVPRNYDTFMGPIFFTPYALDLVSRIKSTGKVKVLELAAGTGRVTKHILEALPEAEIIATDISEDMMNIGKEIKMSENVKWQNVNMMEIPYPNHEFDIIICQFGLMFVPDKPKALAEMYRVLKPGGQILINSWGNIEQNTVWQLSLQLFRQTFGTMPMPIEVSPFSLPAIDTVIELMKDANFRNITGAEVHKITEVASSHLVAKGFLMTVPILKEKPELFDEMFNKLVHILVEKLGDNPLRSPLLALVFEATK